ncbi:MAG: hypothetical protein ACRCSS_09720 [Shewanella sp.]
MTENKLKKVVLFSGNRVSISLADRADRKRLANGVNSQLSEVQNNLVDFPDYLCMMAILDSKPCKGQRKKIEKRLTPPPSLLEWPDSKPKANAKR